MGGWLIIWVGLIVAGLAAGGFISVRKGENQVVIRTSILLVVTCCYLMQVPSVRKRANKDRPKLTRVVLPDSAAGGPSPTWPNSILSFVSLLPTKRGCAN
ncbi:BZ3500_MvSof-1268-A1-R1_Chr3-3g06476 [Microbotryum saponariae]|uniref:BZ3500_MvSof-1268-A1-R1_Chr3-3g06476 protein n=1 Tax=Microbotryum saponariae TaxID=289078 RepID=A0A2X0LYB4_9BASI|nr:BZ3500_MvSof-1268-A1-R1_Chr3-3g06476 [Microbotryum saponariae]SDA04443.1 BZ3501_MvSof-1269-A2-R1_Chr3-2g06163 [Microbotryum saponariae]